MFCTNCGAKIEDGARFCINCGTPVDASPAPEPLPVESPDPAEPAAEAVPEIPVTEAAAEAPVEPEEPVSEAPSEDEPPAPPAKKKRRLLIPIVAAAAVIVIAAVALCFPYISNFFGRTFSKPADYYHRVEMKSLGGMVDSVGSYYKALLDTAGSISDFGVNGSVELSAGKALQKLLKEEDMEAELGWLSSVRADYSFNQKDQLAGGEVTFKLNKSKLFSANLFLDMDEGQLFAQVPELSKNYVTVDMGDLGGMSYLLYSLPRPVRNAIGAVGSVDAEQKQMVADIVKALPDQASFENLLEKYLRIAVNAIDDVEKDKETLTAASASGRYAALEVKIDGKTLSAIVENVCKELKQDADVKRCVTDVAKAMGMDADDAYGAVIDAVEDLLDSADRIADSDAELEMTLYLDGKGNVVGREIKLDDMKVKYASISKGGKGGVELSVKRGGSTVFSLAGDTSFSASGVRGELTLKTAGENIGTITLDKVSLSKLRHGEPQGSITLKPSKQLLENLYLSSSVESIVRKLSLTLEMDSSGNAASMKLIVNHDADQLAALAINGKKTAAGKINAVKDGYEPEEWVENLKESDVRSFIKSLKKTDIPKEYIENIEDLFDSYI